MGTKCIRVIICDDHSLIREGLRKVLSCAGDIDIVAESDNAAELINAVRSKAADLIIMDINLPGRSGLDVLTDLRRHAPHTSVLVISMYPEDRYALRALRSGAAGYLPKGSDPGEIVRAVRKIAHGGRYITEATAALLLEDLGTSMDALPHERLSKREFEIMRLIVDGKTVRQIAEQLHLSISTVNTYRARILDKLHLRSDVELVRYALHNRLID